MPRPIISHHADGAHGSSKPTTVLHTADTMITRPRPNCSDNTDAGTIANAKAPVAADTVHDA